MVALVVRGKPSHRRPPQDMDSAVGAPLAALGGEEIMNRSNKPIARPYKGVRANLVGELFITGDFS